MRCIRWIFSRCISELHPCISLDKLASVVLDLGRRWLPAEFYQRRCIWISFRCGKQVGLCEARFLPLKYSVELRSSTRPIPEVASNYRVVQNKRIPASSFKCFVYNSALKLIKYCQKCFWNPYEATLYIHSEPKKTWHFIFHYNFV